jgi:hypothetical protein
MARPHSFAEKLTKAGKPLCNITDKLISVLGYKLLKMVHIYGIIKAVKEEKTLLNEGDSK